MLSKALSLVLLLVASFSFDAHAIPATVKPALSPRHGHPPHGHPPHFATSASASCSVQVQSFQTSWQSLSQSFVQTQSVFEQRADVSVAYESVQTLYQSYQSTVSQYQSYDLCNNGLAQSGFQTQFQQSVTTMYRSFQSIIIIGKQTYGYRWETQFTQVFQKMSSFGNFCQTVASGIQIDLGGILGGLGLNINLFVNIGINLGGILGGPRGGSFSNGFGGRPNGGLVGSRRLP
ncbi:hypothetical protein PTTG_03595 [Puccinia triticina 1-1 BBBD Race 1]|uniref:Uncharacterized protein n=2 Tax=Puccinia triticina TaxID=208348 RepID=A0A180GHQ0_PUCT1|nr:uncharacterized protein PtA15_2A192 [Puccinia triticina]OAV91999.1 hypothetical protein PTTG_03595 [Puccinia triticina 1-1 BBBD Race 1]WAQ81879.1 hypothetical protein PtA15_2A192 [Puccinia triticina]WAR52766.1 hypothetical protein PtB15_2B191 [Puccinia triticina]